MRTWTKPIRLLVLTGVLALAIALAVGFVTEEQPQEVSNKAAYLAQVTKNCEAQGLDASICRCFYGGMLERNTVEEVFRFDLGAMADPSGYQYTEEQKLILSECLR